MVRNAMFLKVRLAAEDRADELARVDVAAGELTEPAVRPSLRERDWRAALDAYWAEHDETLGHIIRHVLIHEIGHHFGLSDADMEAIEAAAG